MKNTTERYGWVSVVLHWGMAIAIIGMFALGLWMSDLSYYDAWYREAPHLHKSVGLLLSALLLFRLCWRLGNTRPADAAGMAPWEIRSAHLTHLALYLLLVLLMAAGYLISTADGRAIAVFNWFELPALIHDLPDQEDIAGEIHEILAWLMIGVVSVHALAALKHHFINRDDTLRKMLGLASHDKP